MSVTKTQESTFTFSNFSIAACGIITIALAIITTLKWKSDDWSQTTKITILSADGVSGFLTLVGIFYKFKPNGRAQSPMLNRFSEQSQASQSAFNPIEQQQKILNEQRTLAEQQQRILEDQRILKDKSIQARQSILDEQQKSIQANRSILDEQQKSIQANRSILAGQSHLNFNYRVFIFLHHRVLY